MAARVGEWQSHYVYFALLRNAPSFAAAASGLIPGLSRNDILTTEIALPPTKAEQEAIAGALSDTDREISVLGAKLAKVRQIKLGMMQYLLTGKIRLV
jgi:type I restriction enzyme, S subunit